MEYKSTDKYGNKYWYKDPEMKILHREDGPAIEYASGTKEWYRGGLLHRKDGPAIEVPNGTKIWCLDGKNHREDGPAIEWFDGNKSWWLFDAKYTKEQYEEIAPLLSTEEGRTFVKLKYGI